MDAVQERVLITTPAQAAMEGHGLTDAVLIIGSDAELYPQLQGRSVTPRAVAYSVYCPAKERYSVVTLDGRWVIPGVEGYKSRGAVTTYVRKNVAVLRPDDLVILEPVRHNGRFAVTRYGQRRQGTCRGALGISTRGMYGYDCSCGATVQLDGVRRMGWVIVRDGRGSHTVSYALDRSHAREFGTVPCEVPETANVVVAGGPVPEPEPVQEEPVAQVRVPLAEADAAMRQAEVTSSPVAPWHDAVPGDPIKVETPKGTVEVRYAGYYADSSWAHCTCSGDDVCTCPPYPVMLCFGEGDSYEWEDSPERMAETLGVAADAVRAALPGERSPESMDTDGAVAFPGGLLPGESVQPFEGEYHHAEDDGYDWAFTTAAGHEFRLCARSYERKRWQVARAPFSPEGSSSGGWFWWAEPYDGHDEPTDLAAAVAWCRKDSASRAWADDVWARYGHMNKERVAWSAELVETRLEDRVWRVERYGRVGIMASYRWGWEYRPNGRFAEAGSGSNVDGAFRKRAAYYLTVGGLDDIPTERWVIAGTDAPHGKNATECGPGGWMHGGCRARKSPGRFLVDILAEDGSVMDRIGVCAEHLARRLFEAHGHTGDPWHEAHKLCGKTSGQWGSWVDWKERLYELVAERVTAALEAGEYNPRPDVVSALYAEARVIGEAVAAKAARADKQKKAAVQAGSQTMQAEEKTVKAPKVSGIAFDGERGRERAQLLGHAYWVSMLAGTYFVKHLESGVEIAKGVQGRPAMKRAILTDAVERGQRQITGAVVKVAVAAPSTAVETTPEESAPEYGWELYGQRFAIGDVVRPGHPRAEEGTGVVASVRERGDGEQIAGVRWGRNPVPYEQWSGTLVSVPVTVVERAEAPQALTPAPAPKAELADVVDAEIVDDEPQECEDCEESPCACWDPDAPQPETETRESHAAETYPELRRWLTRWQEGDRKRVLNLFCGPGGACVALRRMLRSDVDMICVDSNARCVATQNAAGCTAIQADVTTLDPSDPVFRDVHGLIITPPCIDYTDAGKRLGRLTENIDILGEAWDCARRAAGTIPLCGGDHPDFGKEVGRRLPDGATWFDVRRDLDGYSGETGGLMLEIAIWSLGLEAAGAPLEWVAVEQSSKLPEEIRGEVVADFQLLGWSIAEWKIADAADYGGPSHRVRALLYARRDGGAMSMEAPGDLTTGAAQATGLPQGTTVWTRGNRKTSGGNAFTITDEPCTAITSKVRSWDVAEHGGRFTLEQVAALVTMPRDFPAQGSRTAICQQLGDVFMPVAAVALLGAAQGVAWIPALREYLAEQFPNVHGVEPTEVRDTSPADGGDTLEPKETADAEGIPDVPAVRYTPNSVIVPDTAPEILRWAACHIENVGLHQGQRLFNGPGRTVTLACRPRGALSVAAGFGRIASGRTYDHDAIRAAEREALRLLAEHVTGQPMEVLTDSAAVRACYWRPVDEWGMAQGRTAAEVAKVMRAVAAGAAPDADTAENPAEGPAGDGGQDSPLADTGENQQTPAEAEEASAPVAVFTASRNTAPTKMRVLWRMTRAEAMRLCSDDRSAGRNHMLCWTADPGTEGEDWAFVEDNGSHDGLLADLGIVPARTWQEPEPEPELIVAQNPPEHGGTFSYRWTAQIGGDDGYGITGDCQGKVTRGVPAHKSFRAYWAHGESDELNVWTLGLASTWEEAQELIREHWRRSRTEDACTVAVRMRYASGEWLLPDVGDGEAITYHVENFWTITSVQGHRYEVTSGGRKWLTYRGDDLHVHHIDGDELVFVGKTTKHYEQQWPQMLGILRDHSAALAPADTAEIPADVPAGDGGQDSPLAETGEIQAQLEKQVRTQMAYRINDEQRRAVWRLAGERIQQERRRQDSTPEPVAPAVADGESITPMNPGWGQEWWLFRDAHGYGYEIAHRSDRWYGLARLEEGTGVGGATIPGDLKPVVQGGCATADELLELCRELGRQRAYKDPASRLLERMARQVADVWVSQEPIPNPYDRTEDPMRKTVLVPVEKTLCDAHVARDGSEVEATEQLTLGGRSWDLCGEHAEKFAGLLVEALGEPGTAADVAEIPDQGPAGDGEADSPPADTGENDDQEQSEQDDEAPTEFDAVDGTRPSVMLCGRVPGYHWDDARDALRRAGYEVVGRADDSTVLLVLGEDGEYNTKKLQDARERGIPCMDVRESGRFRDAVRSGRFEGGDRLPQPVKAASSGTSEKERGQAIRAWARSHGYTVTARGRLSARIKEAYERAHRNEPEQHTLAA
ncbi:DUF6197 family protein [Streptomyces sp. NPDC037389]|uniref:DUF6197 family protein n=1 Tax=Streptomyces sp. NPDC037389 TaxID=3155369 RepID=UPI0033F3E2C3